MFLFLHCWSKVKCTEFHWVQRHIFKLSNPFAHMSSFIQNFLKTVESFSLQIIKQTLICAPAIDQGNTKTSGPESSRLWVGCENTTILWDSLLISHQYIPATKMACLKDHSTFYFFFITLLVIPEVSDHRSSNLAQTYSIILLLERNNSLYLQGFGKFSVSSIKLI